MRKRTMQLLTTGLLAIMAAGSPFIARAAEMTDSPATAKTKKRDTLPFSGKIKAVDKSAMTITLAGKEKDRTFAITSQTKMTMAGKPATFDDAVAGLEVGGQARMAANGQQEVLSLRIGPKPEEKTAKPSKAKGKTAKDPSNSMK